MAPRAGRVWPVTERDQRMEPDQENRTKKGQKVVCLCLFRVGFVIYVSNEKGLNVHFSLVLFLIIWNMFI